MWGYGNLREVVGPAGCERGQVGGRMEGESNKREVLMGEPFRS